MEEIEKTREKIQNFEMTQSSLFEQTAENRARNKTIIWWLLNISYIQDEDGNNKALLEKEIILKNFLYMIILRKKT